MKYERRELYRSQIIISTLFEGSHVKLKRITLEGRRIVIVPLHKDLPEGTLHSISRQAGITFAEFRKFFEND